MAFVTSKLPCHYVDYLIRPGLRTRGGIVPLNMYMGSHKNGSKSDAFLTALFGAKLADLDSSWWTPQWCVPPNELAIMKKGQGNDVFYVRLWDWIWDNQEQLGTSSSQVLRDVYDKYFVRRVGGANPLAGMVKDAYFGNECIGFVSNYLRHIKFWPAYQGVDNHRWSIHFPKVVSRLEDVRSLDLLEWSDVGHIALVDDVHDITRGTLKLDVSQCSGFTDLKGPMSNTGVSLQKSGDQYVLSGDVPVPGAVQVRRNPNLQYGSPRHARTPVEGKAAESVFARR